MLNFFGTKKKPDPSKLRARNVAAPRVDTTVNGEWRFKPVGKIVSSWSKVVISDLSRVSANMMAEREFKAQDLIEVRMVLESGPPVTFDAAIVRSEKAGTKFKVALAFRHVNEEASHQITRFVNKRMTELRGRGLV